MTATQGTTPTTVTETASHVVLQPQKLPREKFRRDYEEPKFVIDSVELDLKLEFERTEVNANLTMRRAEGREPCALVLDGQDLDLRDLSVNSHSLCLDGISQDLRWRFEKLEDQLVIERDLLPTGNESFTVKSRVFINPTANLQLMGLFRSNEILLTQCEAEGFRRISFFIDRPDCMSRFKVRLEGCKSQFPVLLSNGNCTEKGEAAEGRHFVIFEDPHLKPCYLFAVVAGRLHQERTTYKHPKKENGKVVEVSLYCEPSEKHKLQWALDSIKKAMQWDEDRYGLEYDLEVFNLVCVRDFNMGAMENKSLNVFLSSLLLASVDSSTDTDFLNVLAVVGHEYFHNWTGNRVTCRDWFQLTLKEGLTVFRDQEFSADMGSACVKRIEDVLMLRAKQFPEDGGPLAHPIRPESYIAMDNFYTLTVYEKGAEVIRMYQTLYGVNGFRKGMDLYFKRHDGHAVTCDDFRQSMADANETDLAQFERWYTQAGTPTVVVSNTSYDGAAKTFSFALSQIIPMLPKDNLWLPLHIPIRMGLIGKTSKTDVVPERVLELRSEVQAFVIEDVKEEPILSILRGFSAPVRLQFDALSLEDSTILAGFDSDGFNRWEQCQRMSLAILKQRIKTPETAHLAPLVVESLRNILRPANMESQDRAFASLALTLPTEEVVVQETRPVDPTAVHEARESLRRDIAAALKSELTEVYDKLTEEVAGETRYSLAPHDVGTRQLRNLCLAYLTNDKSDPEAAILAYVHYQTSSNMTDRMSALRALVNTNSVERTLALDHFYQLALGDPQIMDKWFAVQASADRIDTLEIVRGLKDSHEHFTMKTPPRMRALCVVFALNRAQFHRGDGEGYKFLADVTLELDAFNAQVAARTCNFLTCFGDVDEKRKELMITELTRVQSSPRLSKDLQEILSKSLAAKSR